MADISADLIKKLREQTGAKMMDCKQALVETGGHLEDAKDWLRKKGIASAVKKAGRAAGEGVIAATAQGGFGVMLELNCETDFVARSKDFQDLVSALLEKSIAGRCGTLDALSQADVEGAVVSEKILEMAGKLSENLVLRRYASMNVSPGVVVSYVHSPIGPKMGKIGVLVGIESSADSKDLEDLGKKIAMHVAASKPSYIAIDHIPQQVREREQAILKEQMLDDKRPAHIIEKILDGRMAKFFEEIALEEQAFVFEPDKKVKDILAVARKDMGIDLRISEIVLFLLGASDDA